MYYELFDYLTIAAAGGRGTAGGLGEGDNG